MAIMHPIIFAAFNRICLEHNAGGRVLEIGACPADDTLLCLPALSRSTDRIGINLEGPYRHRGFEILRGNANCMTQFADSSFDTVLCNSVLEHDSHFWQSLEEIRRVASAGALIILGVPSYGSMGTWIGRGVSRFIAGMSIAQRGHRLEALAASAATLGIHNYPGDYYRFSEQAMQSVLLSGLTDRFTMMVLQPPRVIGWGIKPSE